MSPPPPIMDGLVATPDYRARRTQPAARPAPADRGARSDAATVATLTRELVAARDECERISQRLPAIDALARDVAEQLARQRCIHERAVAQLEGERSQVARLAELLVDERAASSARVAALHAQAAEAIQIAEERAAQALHEARELVDALGQGTASVAETRLATELEHVRREKAELEQRLRGDLDRATAEKIELRTRLGICEHALAERDDELERERTLADEALRWASSVEHELVQAPVPAARPAREEDDDRPARPAPDPATSPLRRRGGRVRLRPAG
jgi:hypothetical protein